MARPKGEKARSEPRSTSRALTGPVGAAATPPGAPVPARLEELVQRTQRLRQQEQVLRGVRQDLAVEERLASGRYEEALRGRRDLERRLHDRRQHLARVEAEMAEIERDMGLLEQHHIHVAEHIQTVAAEVAELESTITSGRERMSIKVARLQLERDAMLGLQRRLQLD